MLVVVACLCWATASIVEMVIKFRSRESTTKVSLQYVNSLTFPAITFCNLNQWQRSGTHDASLEMIATIYGFNDTLRDEFNWTAYYEVIPKAVVANITALALSPRTGALYLEKMLLDCVWNGAEKCDVSDFNKVITDLGVCYTFNDPPDPTQVRAVTKPGTDSGLALTLNIGHQEYIRGEYQGAGFKVCIHLIYVRVCTNT